MFSALIYYKDRSTFLCLPDVQTGEKQVLLSMAETGWKEDCLIRFFAIDGLWRVVCPRWYDMEKQRAAAGESRHF